MVRRVSEAERLESKRAWRAWLLDLTPEGLDAFDAEAAEPYELTKSERIMLRVYIETLICTLLSTLFLILTNTLEFFNTCRIGYWLFYGCTNLFCALLLILMTTGYAGRHKVLSYLFTGISACDDDMRLHT